MPQIRKGEPGVKLNEKGLDQAQTSTTEGKRIHTGNERPPVMKPEEQKENHRKGALLEESHSAMQSMKLCYEA